LTKKEHRWSIRPSAEMAQYYEEHQDQFNGVKTNMIHLMWSKFKASQRSELKKRLQLIEAERLQIQTKLNESLRRDRLAFQIDTGDEKPSSKFDAMVVEFQDMTKRNWMIAKPFTTLQGKRRTKEQNFHDLMEVPLERLRNKLKLSTGLSDDLLLETAKNGNLLQKLTDLNAGPA